MITPTIYPKILCEKIAKEIQSVGDYFLICVAEKNLIDIVELINLLNQQNINFIGVIVPAIIHDCNQYNDHILVKKLDVNNEPILIKGLDSGEIVIPDISLIGLNSLIVFVDGKSDYISRFLLTLYNHISHTISVVGSGISIVENTPHESSIFTKIGLIKDAACIIGIKANLGIGVKHGLKKIEGPIIATKTDNNKIEELNWQPAMDLYRPILERHLSESITKDNYYEHFLHYPLGINRDGEECIVRDTVSFTDKGSLICMAEILENSVLYIMKGIKPDLIDAARQAAKDSISNVNGNKIKDVFVIDCIRRYEILGNDFVEELKAVKDSYGSNINFPLEGILSTGEISSQSKGLLDLYNETIVISNFY